VVQPAAQAISTDRTTTFTLDAVDRRYDTNGAASPGLPPEVALAMTTATGGKPRLQSAISFSPDGSSSGGRVLVVGGGHQLEVVVDWLSGRVVVANAP
jgi:general secretion pathway protein H